MRSTTNRGATTARRDTRSTLLALVLGLPALALCLQALAPNLQAQGATHRSERLAVTFAMPRIKACPERSTTERAALYAKRLAVCFDELQRVAAPRADALAGPMLRLDLVGEAIAARTAARDHCGRELQQRGVLHRNAASAVLTATARTRDDATVWRATLHTTTQLLMHRLIPHADENRLGYGWLTTGLAHRLEATVDGTIDTFVVREVVMPPLTAWRGDWQTAATEMLQRGQLPRLEALLATESSDFDPAQHVLAWALVQWLAGRSAPVTHGKDATAEPPLAAYVRAAGNAEPARLALPRILGKPLDEIERELHRSLLPAAGARGLRERPTTHHAPHPHAAVFVYTKEPVRERHRKVVAKALAQRHAAHTSGWQRVDGKPRVAIGPVNQAAGFWHGDDLQKNIPRTWPMVAVLEYESKGNPVAYLDCFRRPTGQNGDKGWLLDPSVGFVPHHNAQLVTDHDDRFHYLAVPDTPTGSHVGGSEFVHRGRVSWAGGQRAAVGVLTLLASPKTKNLARWHSQQTPLVDWLVADRNKTSGVKLLRAIDDLERELAIWGTPRVFRFPEIPDGMTAGRGR